MILQSHLWIIAIQMVDRTTLQRLPKIMIAKTYLAMLRITALTRVVVGLLQRAAWSTKSLPSIE